MYERFPAYVDEFPLASECAPGGVIVYYADGGEEIIHVNSYVVELFECEDVEEFLELTRGSFHTFVHEEDIDAATDSIWGQVEHHSNLDHIYYRIRTKSGRIVNIDDYGRLVERSEGRPVFHVFITKLENRSSIDWLTGLPAMSRFHELATLGADVIRGRGERPVAVALDLVDMKSFNSQYGREEGDKLLRVFGEVLRKHFGSEACSRFAEDHYYAFATEEGISERIMALFSDFRAANDGKVLPIRAGAYVCHAGDDIVATGFDRAKIACDADRKTWHSHLEWFSDEMRAQARLRIHILDNVERAIREGWVRPYYQAIVRASTSYICGEEALARWVDPEYGPLSPAVFIPLLEDAGLLQKLDMHMVECVIADMAVKHGNDVPIVPVSVNISLRDLGELDVAGEIIRCVDAAGLPHDLLRVEFTESASSEDPELFKAQVATLRRAGLEVWMDDFGSGYSSLNTLQDFEFDLIKLDMGFIRDLGNERARAIVSGVVQTAKKMGVNTLCEGVETEEQALFLEGIGCDMLQGFYYTQPLPLEVIVDEAAKDGDMVRERRDESAYWGAIGKLDVANPTANVDELAADGSKLAEFPAGVMERRGEEWRLVRANGAYRSFLDRGGAIPLQCSNLESIVFPHGVDLEYAEAAERSSETGMWERVAGRMEYGTGLQFYTKPLASAPQAEAFALVSVPTMLGTALGTYGDVPVAYAVLRVITDERDEHVVGAEYVYANSVYCEWCGYSQHDIPGASFTKLATEGGEQWFPYFHKAAVLKESAHDVRFSKGVGHWLSFNIAPSLVERCCTFAFTIVDDEHRQSEEMRIGRDTSDLIIDIANVFNSNLSYEDAMNAVLEKVSRLIHPDHLGLFELVGASAVRTFTWVAESARGGPGGPYASEGVDAGATRVGGAGRVAGGRGGLGNRGAPRTAGGPGGLGNRGDTRAAGGANVDAEGAVRLSGEMPRVMGSEDVRMWKRLIQGSSAAVISDVGDMASLRPGLRDDLVGDGVTHLFAVPLYQGMRLIGLLVADNYQLEEDLDAPRLLETVASFMSARIVNQRLLDELEQAGTHDSLTGLMNRRGVDAAIRERLEGEPGVPYALGLVDVDDFKALNDMHGHDVGDEALRVISHAISEVFSCDAVLGRNGGDEFLVVVFGQDAARAGELFAQLSAMNLDFEWNAKRYHTSLSIGYVEHPAQVGTLKNAYAFADTALYAVKLSGKSGYRRYSDDLDAQYRTLLGFSSRDLAENIPGGIMVHKATDEGDILFANDELISMMECENLADFMAFTGGVADGIVLAEDVQRVRDVLAGMRNAQASGQKAFANYRVVTKSGKVRHAAANSRLVDVQDIGQVFYVIVVDRDERGSA